MKQKYEITFICRVTLEANDKEEAVRLAWLSDNQNYKGTYEFKSIKEIKEGSE